MVIPQDTPRDVEVITASAAAASSPSQPPPQRSVILRGKPRSRLPVLALKSWANQRLLRCATADSAGNGTLAPDAPSSTFPPPSALPASRRRLEDEGFERIKAKLMDHLRKAAGRIELPAVVPREERRNEPVAEVPLGEFQDVEDEPHAAVPDVTGGYAASAEAALSAEELPWNLRTRRSMPTTNGRYHHADSLSPSPAVSRLRSGTPERREAALRRRRPRFSVPLTKEEIDEDVYAFTARLASRRPKKRPRAVQKQLDMLFPGLCLSEVTADMYTAADPPPPLPS